MHRYTDNFSSYPMLQRQFIGHCSGAYSRRAKLFLFSFPECLRLFLKNFLKISFWFFQFCFCFGEEKPRVLLTLLLSLAHLFLLSSDRGVGKLTFPRYLAPSPYLGICPAGKSRSKTAGERVFLKKTVRVLFLFSSQNAGMAYIFERRNQIHSR